MKSLAISVDVKHHVHLLTRLSSLDGMSGCKIIPQQLLFGQCQCDFAPYSCWSSNWQSTQVAWHWLVPTSLTLLFWRWLAVSSVFTDRSAWTSYSSLPDPPPPPPHKSPSLIRLMVYVDVKHQERRRNKVIIIIIIISATTIIITIIIITTSPHAVTPQDRAAESSRPAAPWRLGCRGWVCRTSPWTRRPLAPGCTSRAPARSLWCPPSATPPPSSWTRWRTSSGPSRTWVWQRRMTMIVM